MTALACGAPPPELAQHADLVAAFPEAEIHREIGLLDMGTPAARPHLGEGWSWDETTGQGTTFVWGGGSGGGGRSELTFFLAEPRRLSLSFRAFPFAFPEAPLQAVTVRVNGEALLEVELASGMGDYGVELPRDSLRAGENHLAFAYRWSRSPAQVGLGADTRLLAVGWEWIRLGVSAPGGEEGAAAPRAEGELLYLPHGSQVDYFLRLPPGAELAVGESAHRGGAGRLEVWAARDRPAGGVQEELLLSRERGGEAWRQTLTGAADSGLLRLSLRAVGESGTASHDEGRGGIALRRPRILAPAAHPTGAREAETASSASPPEISQPESTLDRETSPNLVVYLVDTLRADRLGAYGNQRGLTPRLDAFAGAALVFENAIAASSWTKPSVASLFTGHDPWTHGVQQPEDGLPESAPLLAELLRQGGYRTAALVANAHITRVSGFARGFDLYETYFAEPNDAAVVLERAAELLAGPLGADSAPFFLYLHTIDPHAPYQPPVEFRRRFAAQVTDPEIGSFESIRALAAGTIPRTPEIERDLALLYDAEVARTDAAFGSFLDTLDRLELRRDTAILFLSDHGEEFYEHGVLGHGWDLYNEVLQIPLLLALPEASARRTGGPDTPRDTDRPVATHVDLFPTLLRLAGQPVPEGLPGRDLLEPAERAEVLTGPRALSHQDYEERAGASLAVGPWHLIEPLNGRFAPGPELYDRLRDPLEQDDLMRARPVLAGYLRRLLREHLREVSTLDPSPVELDAETRRQLEALGYLNR